jgi:hypothetical protein
MHISGTYLHACIHIHAYVGVNVCEILNVVELDSVSGHVFIGTRIQAYNMHTRLEHIRTCIHTYVHEILHFYTRF